MNKIFVIGDTHFGHSRILEFEKEKRPFRSIEEHDRNLIINWNKVVRPKDVVWHLGDIAFGENSIHILSKLNGNKHLIMGNHDRYSMEIYQMYFRKIVSGYSLGGYLLTHIPIHPSQFYRFKGNIHGHVHSNSLDDKRYFNASAENINLTPIEFRRAIEHINL